MLNPHPYSAQTISVYEEDTACALTKSYQAGHFKKRTVRYKKIGYNIDVLRQTACLVVIPIKVNSFAYLFNCTTVGRTSD